MVSTSARNANHIPWAGRWPVSVSAVCCFIVLAAAAQAVVAAEPNSSRRDKVTQQVAAGEYGPALETAQSTQDPAERAALLQTVADAQMQSGDFEASHRTIRRFPAREDRTRVRGKQNAEQSLAGGSGADPDELIQLIQDNTSGPWEEDSGEGGTITYFDAGVRIDPNGKLAEWSRRDLTNRLEALGIKARRADLNTDMAQPSELRLVSLTRLEREAARRLEQGQPVLETMKQLAGLTQVHFVFIYPDAKEIVIGGPAEGWRYDENGMPIGAESARPTLQLDDLVTVLRTFNENGPGIVRCSIDPRPEGLKQLKQFVQESNARGPLDPAAVRPWVRQLGLQLGLQKVDVSGVPVDSRVGQVIVEADYRMKLIGIGKRKAVSGVGSFFDLLPAALQKNSPEMDGLRWWLTMKYDAIMHSTDRSVFEIQGSSVKCLSENELITSEGHRVPTGKTEATNRLFAANFTKHFAELAKQDPAFADLQNVFDLALVAALVRQERDNERATWDMGAFATDGAYRPATYDSARAVMSVVNHRVYNGKNIVVQVAGGVHADVRAVVNDKNLVTEQPRLASYAKLGRAPKLPEGRWWWDAAK